MPIVFSPIIKTRVKWHSFDVQKKVPVKPHFRDGRPVIGHERLVDSNPGGTTEGGIDGIAAGVAALAIKENTAEIREQSFGIEDKDQSMEIRKWFDWKEKSGLVDGDGLSKVKKFENCKFSSVLFHNVNLSGVEFVGCDFSTCEFENVDLSNVTFKNCKFNKNNFFAVDSDKKKRVIWGNLTFEKCDFVSCRIQRTNIENSRFSNCSFERTHVDSKSHFQNVFFEDSKFVACSFDGVRSVDSGFHRCSLENFTFFRVGQDRGVHTLERLDFVDSSLIDCMFSESNFSKSNFSGSRLEECEFGRVDLLDANFSDTEADKTFFYLSNLNYANLSSARWKKTLVRGGSLLGVNWKNVSFSCDFLNEIKKLEYEQFTFSDTIKNCGISQKEFEFLVLSGAIEVRDNETLERVRSEFDPNKNHVPVWAFENLKHSTFQ